MTGFGQLTETDTIKLNIQVSFNGNCSFGNVERILIFTRAEVILSSTDRKWVLKTQDSYRYGTVRSNRTENDLVLANYFYHRPFKKVYPYIMMSYENTVVKTIRHRIGGGPGITVVPVKNKSSLLKLSVTAFIDRTIYTTTGLDGAHPDPYSVNTWRPTLRIYEWHQLKERLTFFYEFIDQLSVSKTGNHRLIGAAGINYQCSGFVDLISRLNYTHEDIQPRGIKADDWYLTFGINLHYKTIH